MKKIRLTLAIAVASLAINACVASPTALDDEDCDETADFALDEGCEIIKPSTGGE